MKHLTLKHVLLLSVIWPGCLALLLFSSPAFASGTGYEGHSKGHGNPHSSMGTKGHGSSHHKANYSGHGSGHHGNAIKDHGVTGGHGSYGKGHSGGHGKHGGGGHGKHTGAHQSASEFIKHVLKYKDGMAITDEQEAKLKSVRTAFKKSKIKMKAEVELANLDLHELLKNEESSLSDIESKLKNVHMLEADLLMASVKAKRDAKAVLTDEQRKRMKAVHDRIQAYASGGMASKGHPGGYKHHGKDGKKDSY
ncbi:MAG: Spy/CpxP family protein refolding chaperone [Nitrospirales bacterium]